MRSPAGILHRTAPDLLSKTAKNGQFRRGVCLYRSSATIPMIDELRSSYWQHYPAVIECFLCADGMKQIYIRGEERPIVSGAPKARS